MAKHLILGGARSGKSLFAENLALQIYNQAAKNSQLYYLATCEAADAEMRARVLKHKQRRDDGWINVEQPLDIATFLQSNASNAVILVDCLTLWINNLIYHKYDVEPAFERLYKVLETSETDIIFVSNELGMGLVPETKLGREFRDFQGLLNQQLAQKVDKVALIVAGLPLWLK